MGMVMVLDEQQWLVLFTFHNGLRIANRDHGRTRKNGERQSIIISNELAFVSSLDLRLQGGR